MAPSYVPTAPVGGGAPGGTQVDDVHAPSHAEGIGVVAATSARHLFVARFVSRVTFGCIGSPDGVPTPLPPYSSANPNALWPISWIAILGDGRLQEGADRDRRRHREGDRVSAQEGDRLGGEEG